KRRQLRGVVLAHDARLTDLYALAIDEPGAIPESFAASLVDMYGASAPAEAAGVGRLSGDTAERFGLLMVRAIVALAARLAVMSEHAARLVRLDARPEHVDRVVMVPFGMRTPIGDATPTDERAPIVATFGIVNEAKQPALLVQSLPRLLELRPDATLAFVGRCSDEY